MIVTTTDFVPGYEIDEILGVVMGNTVRAKHIGKDILAGLKNIVGGEIDEYTEMLRDARIEAVNRMINEAKKMGADAVINGSCRASVLRNRGEAEEELIKTRF